MYMCVHVEDKSRVDGVDSSVRAAVSLAGCGAVVVVCLCADLSLRFLLVLLLCFGSE